MLLVATWDRDRFVASLIGVADAIKGQRPLGLLVLEADATGTPAESTTVPRTEVERFVTENSAPIS